MLTVESALTVKQREIIESVKGMCPKGFLESCPDGPMKNFKILGVFQLALDDFNFHNPRTNFTTGYVPDKYISLITFGSIFFIETLKQAEMSLIDISYSDGGLSITFDRVGKIGSSITQTEKTWLRMVDNAKKGILLANGGVGLGTPRYQSNLSKMIAMVGSGAFGWNVP
jgi:hypothetical protein